MISFEKLFKLIEEGISFDNDGKNKKLRIDYSNDNPDTDVIFLNPPEWWFGVSIANRAKQQSLGISSLFAAYIIRDKNSVQTYKFNDGNDLNNDKINDSNDLKIGAGSNITNIVYHTLKKGVSDKSGISLYVSPKTASSKDYVNLQVLSKKDVDTLENNGIDLFINIFKQYNPNIKFDFVEYPESKSVHVNFFSSLTFKKLKQNGLLQSSLKNLAKIDKRDIKDMYEDFILYNNDIKYIYDNLSPKDRESIFITLTEIIFLVISRDNSIKTICDKLLPGTTLYDYDEEDQIKNLKGLLNLSIFLTSWLINIKENISTPRHLSSANDIRVTCNYFTMGIKWSPENDKIINNINKGYGLNIVKQSMQHRDGKITDEYTNRNVTKQIFEQMFKQYRNEHDISEYEITPDNEELDIYSQNYYVQKVLDLKEDDKQLDEIDVLFIDDNMNRGSTIYETSETIKRKYEKIAKKVNVHGCVLLVPIKDLEEVWQKNFNPKDLKTYVTNFGKGNNLNIPLEVNELKSKLKPINNTSTSTPSNNRNGFKNNIHKLLSHLLQKYNINDPIVTHFIKNYKSIVYESIEISSNEDGDLEKYYNLSKDRSYIEFIKGIKKYNITPNLITKKIIKLIENNAEKYANNLRLDAMNNFKIQFNKHIDENNPQEIINIFDKFKKEYPNKYNNDLQYIKVIKNNIIKDQSKIFKFEGIIKNKETIKSISNELNNINSLINKNKNKKELITSELKKLKKIFDDHNKNNNDKIKYFDSIEKLFNNYNITF